MPTTRTSVLTVILGVGLATAAGAQPPAAPTPAQTRAWFDEAVALQKALHPLALRALRDPAVDGARRAFAIAWEAAVRQADPALPKDWEQLPALHAAFLAAQRRQDRAEAERLRRQGLALQARAARAQARAWHDPTVQSRARTFQQALERRMIALDPSAAARLRRLHELERRLDGVPLPAGGRDAMLQGNPSAPRP